LDNMTIKTYKMSIIHKTILLIIFIFTIFFGCIVIFMYNNTIIDIIELLIIFIILYVIAFVYVQEVIIYNNKNIEFRTLLKKIKVNIKQIDYIKGCASTKSWVASFYDKEKAKNYFYIRFKNKPLTILMFSAFLSNYNELYNFLTHSTSPKVEHLPKPKQH